MKKSGVEAAWDIRVLLVPDHEKQLERHHDPTVANRADLAPDVVWYRLLQNSGTR